MTVETQDNWGDILFGMICLAEKTALPKCKELERLK
jgi:hypothetical protein